jgi:hypothetical protein
MNPAIAIPIAIALLRSLLVTLDPFMETCREA